MVDARRRLFIKNLLQTFDLQQVIFFQVLKGCKLLQAPR